MGSDNYHWRLTGRAEQEQRGKVERALDFVIVALNEEGVLSSRESILHTLHDILATEHGNSAAHPAPAVEAEVALRRCLDKMREFAPMMWAEEIAAGEKALTEVARGWQPIESAPKDGTLYLGWSRSVGFLVVNEPPDCMRGRWEQRMTEHGGMWAGGGIHAALRLTHWTELAPPPEVTR